MQEYGDALYALNEPDRIGTTAYLQSLNYSPDNLAEQTPS
jgi:hypothetical protein